jgi:hypothetical protein
MLDLRLEELTPALRYVGYLLEIQATMKSPSREAQLPPLPPGGGDGGDGGGGGGAAADVTKLAVDDHGPWFSGSDARTRQKRVADAGRLPVVALLSPPRSPVPPLQTTDVKPSLRDTSRL